MCSTDHRFRTSTIQPIYQAPTVCWAFVQAERASQGPKPHAGRPDLILGLPATCVCLSITECLAWSHFQACTHAAPSAWCTLPVGLDLMLSPPAALCLGGPSGRPPRLHWLMPGPKPILFWTSAPCTTLGMSTFLIWTMSPTGMVISAGLICSCTYNFWDGAWSLQVISTCLPSD